MNWKTRLVLTLWMIPFALSLGACAPGRAAVRTNGLRDHWNQTVAIENQAMGIFAMTAQRTNEGFMAIKTSYPLAKECFVDSERVLTNAVSGRYDATAATDIDTTNSRPTGEVNGVLIGQALMVNEAYPGDIEICQQMKADIVRDIGVWRQQRANDFAQLWDTKVSLDGRYHGDLYNSIRLDLLNWVKDNAEDLGIPVPEYTYPTFNLKVISKDKKICDFYGMDWNTALSQCELHAKGAYEYMFRLFVAEEVQGSFDSGVDDLNPLEDGDK